MTNITIGIALAIVAVVDLWLVFTKRPTISHRYQALFPTFFDLILLVAVMVVLFEVELDTRLKVVLAILAGHIFFPNKERYGSVIRHVYKFEK